MAGHLLLVVLVYSFSEVKTEALLPPTLTVNPAVITETETVTLNCQTPSSVAVPQCYFRFVRGGPGKTFPCHQTLGGTELLKITNHNLPAEVKVTCFYLASSPSPDSDSSSIFIRRPLPPTLTVNPAVITETETVTLNCQTPSSVSSPWCYFRFVRGGPGKSFLCHQTLTGTELLKVTNQNSPAEVKVTCFYLLISPTPDSDSSSIIIRPSLPPTLTVNPAVITETETVTLNCQTPSSVAVSQCNFYILNGGTRDLSCLQTLTGTELLKMAHQSSSAVVEVTCFYTVKLGETTYPSPHSDTSSITVHCQKPQMSVDHYPGDLVLFTCTLPGPANDDTTCYLYLGERSDPFIRTTIRRKKTSTNQWFCQFYVKIDDLLRHLRLVQHSNASCDYTLGSQPNSLSPRSDGRSLTDVVEKESPLRPTMPTSTMTTSLTVSRSHVSTRITPVTSGWTVGTSSDAGSFSSTSLTTVESAADTRMTPMNPESTNEITAKTWMWKFVAVVAGFGVAVGLCILLVSAFVWSKRRTGPEEVKRRQSPNDNLDTYHFYSTISDLPAASALKSTEYSTVQLH